MELGFRTDFRFGTTTGANHLIKEAIELAKTLGRSYDTYEYRYCYDSLRRDLQEEGPLEETALIPATNTTRNLLAFYSPPTGYEAGKSIRE